MLRLLKQGCTITYPDGYYLKGLPETQYIEVGDSISGSAGLWHLSKEGVKDALADIKKMRKDDEEERR